MSISTMSLNDPSVRSEAELDAERYKFLLTASTMLSAALDYGSAIDALGRAAVPALGEVCLIDMADAGGKLIRTGSRAGDLELTALMETGTAELDPAHPAMRVLQTGEAVFVPELSDTELRLVAGSDETFSLLADRDLRWCLCVPIVARSCMGVLTLLSEGSAVEDKWAEIAPQVAEDLARRAALALDNARLFESARDMAITLQRSLMPSALPTIPGVELAALYHAGGEGAEVGGDFYDVFPTGNDGWAAVIGDVCGKGAEAAALTALARHTIRAANVDLRKPRRILAFLNQIVMQGEHSERFITVAYCRMRTEADCIRVTLGRAGHPPPLVLRSDGTVTPAGRPGTLIGVTAEPSLTDQMLKICPGDAMILYTDGIIEARGSQGRFGQTRLEAILSECAQMSAQEIVNHLEAAVLGFQTELSRDDTAILVIRMPPEPAV